MLLQTSGQDGETTASYQDQTQFRVEDKAVGNSHIYETSGLTSRPDHEAVSAE